MEKIRGKKISCYYPCNDQSNISADSTKFTDFLKIFLRHLNTTLGYKFDIMAGTLPLVHLLMSAIMFISHLVALRISVAGTLRTTGYLIKLQTVLILKDGASL